MAIKREFRDAKEHLHYVSSLINSPFNGLRHLPYALALGIAPLFSSNELLDCTLLLSSHTIYFFGLRWHFRYARYVGHKFMVCFSVAAMAMIIAFATPQAINLCQILSQL